MKTYPRIEDVGDAKIGTVYNVPAVRWTGSSFGRPTGVPEVVPILGPMHEDAEHINFPEPHWHVDWRFVAESNWRCMPESYAFGGRDRFAAARVVIAKNTGPIFRVQRRCRRGHVLFPRDLAGWMRGLEASMAGQTARCGICPHRGVPLAGAPVIDGARVCPGHGLRWRVSDGALVPTPPLPDRVLGPAPARKEAA